MITTQCKIPFFGYCAFFALHLHLHHRIILNKRQTVEDMNGRRITAIAILGVAALQMSCRKGCTDPAATNYDERAKKTDNSCEYPAEELEVPSTYNFVDADGNSTVSFSGQQIRLEMLSEIVTYMKTANTSGTTVDATILKGMYANNSHTWTDANSLGMTGSSKQLKNKTAYVTADGSPDAGIQLYFEDLMDSLAVASTSSDIGSTGVTGVWPNDGVSGPYLMNGDGHEFTQLIEKGLMSAVLASQMTVNYLGTIADDNNTDLEDGKNYTEMQHHWDEAYGYFTSSIDYPTSGTDRFWGKYADGRETLLQSASKISEAFRKGRAAIDAQEYDIRDEQVDIIRDEMEKLQAACAIHYLNGAKDDIANNTTRNHKLSEVYAFLHGMKFGYNSISEVGMTASEIDQALGYIGTNFNAVSVTYLNMAIDLIASKTGLSNVKNDL